MTLLALRLVHVALHGLGGVAARLQAFGQLGGTRLGAHKDEGRLARAAAASSSCARASSFCGSATCM